MKLIPARSCPFLFIVFFCTVFIFQIFAVSAQSIEYKHEYKCGGERLIVDHCRRDDDTFGIRRTTDAENYCLVYYPDRPKYNGFMIQKAELLGDVVKKLEACGAVTHHASQAEIDESVALFRRGDALFKKKDYVHALDYFKQSNAAGPSSAAYLMTGVSQYYLKQYDDAIISLRETIRMVPDNPDAHNWLGAVYQKLGMSNKDLAQYPKAETEFRSAIRLKPEYQSAYANLGMVLFIQQKGEDALKAFGEALRLDPNDNSTKYLVGFTYVQLGRKERAMQVYRQLLPVDPQGASELLAAINKPASGNNGAVTTSISSADAIATQYIAKGDKYYEAGDYAKALTEYQAAIAQKPGKGLLSEAYDYVGDCYTGVRQYDKAIASFTESIKIAPEAPAPHMGLGAVYESMLRLPEAAAAYKEAVRLAPKDANNLEKLGGVYALMRKKPEAMQVYNELLKLDAERAKYLLDDIGNKNGPAGIMVKRGELAMITKGMGGRGSDEETAVFYRNALKLDPVGNEVLFDIGGGLGICGKHDEALAIYRRILLSKPTLKDRATAHYFIGQEYDEMKQYAKALPELLEANRLNPDYYTKTEIGTNFFETKQFAKALAAFQEAMKLNARESGAYLKAGRTYVAMGQVDEGITVIQEFLKVDPKSTYALDEIGKINYEAKRFPAAGRAYSAALQIDPKSPDALYGIGQTYLAVGRKSDAVRAYDALKPIDAKLAQQLFDAINNQ